MNALLNARADGRLVTIIAGDIAIAARTNGSLHAFAGEWFAGSMRSSASPPRPVQDAAGDQRSPQRPSCSLPLQMENLLL